MEACIYRVHAVEQFLKNGIPMSKIDSLRYLLAGGSHRLTHSSHLSEYTPFIYSEERKVSKLKLRIVMFLSSLMAQPILVGGWNSAKVIFIFRRMHYAAFSQDCYAELVTVW